ncbi:MAG: ABC-type glycerol-3-phosphate transport system substrate-binding protein, partial [Pirellulaceae bacterium]
MPHFVILRRCPIFLALAMLTFTGCIDGGADTPTPSHATNGQAANANPRKLRVLVIDDPEFASALQEFWQTQGDGDLVVDQKSQTQILPKHRRLGTDIVIFPCTMLPDMANRRLLAQVPDETWSTDFDGKDLLPNARKLCYYDGLSYAVPLTYSQLQLGYRTDILKAHSIDPPKTWSQYMDAVRQLDAVTDTSWTATCEPLAAGWRSEMFFARHGSFMKHRKITSILFDTKSLQPQLDNDAGKLAITQLTDVAKLNPAQLTQSPTNTLRELISGQTAMAITLPSANVAGKSDGKSHPLAFVPLPSSERYYVMRENSWQ